MESEQNHIADRTTETLVLLIKVRLLGTVMPSPGTHECFKGDFTVSGVSKDFGNLACELYPGGLFWYE
jgi:hypothetical protein